ncbi:hypothetical protein MATL_G00017020 [Megalops atlanticus]|uniref:Uncharacterized protein n=1 Tax=Megalops atlanticus TaxID=7932 RepID=A0A9D3QI23_MEGAT|nr:hypothetical protein MATL_G00017020 [Megalops atlanticus]
MATQNMSSSRETLVSGHPSWVCSTSDSQLGGILHCVRSTNSMADLTQVYTETSGNPLCERSPTSLRRSGLVYLERVEEASPCSIRLQCAPGSGAVIAGLLVVSEARTMEVYTGAGEYCGTCRGERERTLTLESADESISLYKKYLKLETPAASCDVKLLSLGGRARVGLDGIVLDLQDDGTADRTPAAGPSIDLHRVQSMVESMGTTLSPGAQNLMDMVQFQQKNKTDALSGFLPLLLGGGPLAALAKAGMESRAAADAGPQSTASHKHTDTPPGQASQPESTVPDALTGPRTQAEPPHPPAANNDRKLTDAVSSLLNGHPQRAPCGFGPDLLPVLQSVCGQVAQLRVEDGSPATAAPATTTLKEHSCCEALEGALERRLEEMERRLKQHIDQRLDALQHNLERALLAALPLAHIAQGIKTSTPDWHGVAGLLNGDS